MTTFSRKKFLQAASLSLLSSSLFSQTKSPNSKFKKSIGIVGAGMGGISAAFHLKNLGHEVKIFEARNRIGGRIHTNRDLFSCPIDFGASWIHHVERNPLTKIAEKHKLRTHETDWESIYLKDPEKGKLGKIDLVSGLFQSNQFTKELERLSEERAFRSLEECYETALRSKDYSQFSKRIFQFFREANENNEAADYSQINPKWFWEDDQTEGEDGFLVDGYLQVLEVLAKDLPISLGERVKAIRSKEKEVFLDTNKGQYKFDFLVVTIPTSLISTIQFAPELPIDLKRSFQNRPLGLLNKVIFEFADGGFPLEDEEVYAKLANTKPEYNLILNLKPANGKNIAMFFLSGKTAKALEEESDATIQKKLLKELSYLLDKKIAKPKQFFATRWSKDPLSLGSYTFRNVGASSQDISRIQKGFGRIFFGGEAAHLENFSYVDGAFLSGGEIASRIDSF